MHDHREILELAAAEIDFELDPSERQTLRSALEECLLCRRQAAEMRATATVLSRPSDIGTPSRVRDVVIGAALHGERRAPALRSLLLASLSIVAVVGGTVFVAGNRGFGLFDGEPSASVPSPTVAAQASPSPTPGSSRTPSPSPSPTETVTPATLPPIDNGPLRAGDVVTMVTDGRLVIRTLPATGASSAIFKTRLYPGQRAVVLEGPVDGDGYAWYRVRVGDIEGWAAAAGLDGEPWLARVENGVIAFVVDRRDGVSEAIHTVAADGTAEATVVLDDPGLVELRDLAWSSDGQRLAFAAKPFAAGGDTWEIYSIDADGSNLIRITDNEVDDIRPMWAPDGTRIAFESHAAFVGEAVEPVWLDSSVLLADADGSDLQDLGAGVLPVWSPDGQHIAMVVAEDGRGQLWVQGHDGEGRRQVGALEVQGVPPVWSPDGLSLLVQSDGLSIIDVESGAATPLLDDPRGSTSPPSWSIHDAIAFTAVETGAPTVFVIGRDASGRREVLANVGGAAVAKWSPDGRRLLIDDEATGTPLTLLAPDDGPGIEVKPDEGFTRSAAWQPIVRR